jgi:large subunit ribosomal protein L9
MQIILLERVENLGNLGDEVTVKNGYARNFLLPNGKALIANNKNRARFEAEREMLEKRNAEARSAAEQSGSDLDGAALVVIRQSGTTGQLYGSVTARDIVATAAEQGFSIKRDQVRLNAPIKTLGIHAVGVRLHAEVRVDITVNVARSEEEAERQAAGEDIIETLAAEQAAVAEEQASEMAEAAAELDTAPEGDE